MRAAKITTIELTEDVEMHQLTLRRIISRHLAVGLVSYNQALDTVASLAIKDGRNQLTPTDQQIIADLKAEGLYA